MTDTRSTAIAEIIQAQQRISKAISALLGQNWMELDFSMPQLKTLMTLYSAGALPIGQLADTLGVGQPTASHLVDRLVQGELAIRTEDPEDRRRTLAELSPQGVELIERLRQIRIEPFQRWLAQLDDTALAALHLGFRALADVATADISSVHESS
jgi:DNA-binding MarR family transcriptional regulator